ncbi:MAG: pentapeptide repeat-containing protein [Rhodospirillaceae bacterium]|jgi:uncharacterized protein YjbI with pentapeptide repeats|nr:pentapeptide repeat-containing protein [Rhodospirillaceae bacterium]MBT5240017.1 pentapeptide repeat-containing protein [Rhodospirillaceae bacterium]MBT5564321.1 pentapeptide repeat-containing protein [Rhodospirillaceae bacterium]MBT6090116.1 pentapeptide repeat-containing protein [Rhodospirillaceae bacterium]MBT6962090.1 pentapeptide repeat-containing protein [Rhodospirillaceae bacterium]
MAEDNAAPDQTPQKKSFLGRIARSFRRGAIRLENSASFMYLRAFSRAGIILIALGFFLDLDDRQAATKFRAWQTLSSTAPGNIGKAEAMEYLVSVDEVLDRTDARKAYLAGAQIAGVSLSHADLSGSDLTNADLSGAVMIESRLDDAVMPGVRFDSAVLDELSARRANLIRASMVGVSASGANFSGVSLDAADLTTTDLSYANLSGATLTGANLTGATLRMANISGADFSGASGVTRGQATSACIIDSVVPVNMPVIEIAFTDCTTNEIWRRRLAED